MNLTRREKLFLLGAARDLADWRRRPEPTGSGNAATRARIINAADGIVDADPARWLGWDQTPSDRVSNSRTYRSLAEKALIERVGAAHEFGQRFQTRAVKLTPAGETLAAQLEQAERA